MNTTSYGSRNIYLRKKGRAALIHKFEIRSAHSSGPLID
jgi:hypothetical protein